MTTSTIKVCSRCGTDLNGQKRIKDAAGSYFCHPCWALVAKASDATPSSRPDKPVTARDPASSSSASTPAAIKRAPITVGLTSTTIALPSQETNGRALSKSAVAPPVATGEAQTMAQVKKPQWVRAGLLIAVICVTGVLSISACYFFVLKPKNDSINQTWNETSGQPSQPPREPVQGIVAPPDAEKALGLARDYECGRNVPADASKAFRYSLEAANQGNLQAEFGLANSYYYGRGTARNKAEAGVWFRKAAEAGYGPAMHTLAECLAAGDGMAKHDTESESWFRKAGPAVEQSANQGDPNSMVILGVMASNGDGTVAKDQAKAFEWYQRAAELGDRRGMFYLANAYLNGDGTEKNESEAFRWYRKAADLNSPACMTRLGDMYRDGVGVEQNYGEAVRWYGAAVKLNDTEAMDALATLLLAGNGVEKDLAHGVALLKSSAALDDAKAMYALGLYYSSDENSGKDMTLAMRYFRDAAARGNEDAINAVAASTQSQKNSQDDPRAADEKHVQDEQAKAARLKEAQTADEQAKALDALYAPVLKCLNKSYVQPEDCTPKFADLVRGRMAVGQRSTPGKVIEGSIHKHHVDKDGSSATVEALVKYTDRNGDTKEQLISYYLSWDGNRWLINLIDWDE